MRFNVTSRGPSRILSTACYEDRSRIRVAGPFTVESLSPHRVVPADEDELFAQPSAPGRGRKAAMPPVDFAAMVLDHLQHRRRAPNPEGRQHPLHQLCTPWPGEYIGAEGRFLEGETRAPRRNPDRPGIRHPLPPGPRHCGARGIRGRLRRADRLRLQLRRPCLGADKLGRTADPEGAHKPRSAHGRRTEEHRQGQSVRGVRRARHRSSTPAPDSPIQLTVIGVDVFDPQDRRHPLGRHRKASPPGSSTPTTTRRVSSSATPIPRRQRSLQER